MVVVVVACPAAGPLVDGAAVVEGGGLDGTGPDGACPVDADWSVEAAGSVAPEDVGGDVGVDGGAGACCGVRVGVLDGGGWLGAGAAGGSVVAGPLLDGAVAVSRSLGGGVPGVVAGAGSVSPVLGPRAGAVARI